MMSDGNELYIKVVVLDEIYNFLVHKLFIWSRFDAKLFDSHDYIELIPKESILYSRKWVCSASEGSHMEKQSKQKL